MQTVTVWKSRANEAFFQLTKDDVILTGAEMATITKVEIHYCGVYYNSDDYPDVFDWATLADQGKVIIKLGLLDTPVGDDAAELLIYDAVNVAGILWMQFGMEVRGDVAVT